MSMFCGVAKGTEPKNYVTRKMPGRELEFGRFEKLFNVSLVSTLLRK